MDFKKNPKLNFKDVGKLSEAEARDEIDALREGIEYHDYLYYVKDRPEISDETYDKLFRRLQELEGAFPQFDSENSPTRRVGGAPMAGLQKVEHAAPMLSLNAVYDEKEVKSFDGMIRREMGLSRPVYTAEPKFDGLSVELVYEDGTFTRGTTRGDGVIGEDISRNIRTIGAVPLHLRGGRQETPSFLAVRGEVFMRKDDFQKLNKKRIERGEEPFANPRNAAAGSVRQLDPGKVAGIPLDIVFYDILDVRDSSFDSQWAMLQQLPKWGLKTDPHNRKCSNLQQMEKYHADLAKTRDKLDYEIDGIVIKLDDFELREKLGTRQRSPRWALAWKFEPRQEITTLKEIVVQVGRTGVLTPVALLDPINVGGVTVSRATLHNEDEIRRKDVRPGDKVRIVRAGDVIPEVVERIGEPKGRRGKPFSMPKNCPACGTPVHREGAHYYCPNSLSCPGQLVARITHYASRDAMDIAGLGRGTVKELVDRGMVRTLADLYRLSTGDLKQIEGFADKSARQLHDAIQRSKEVRVDRFLYALGVPRVGPHAVRALARHFRTVQALEKAGLEELAAVEDVGYETARRLHSFLRQKENRDVLHELYRAGLQVRGMPSREGAGLLEGKTFVFTGELADHTRREAERLVESMGGRVASSVSGETDFVVAGDRPGSKLNGAGDRGVKVIDEKRFEKLVHS
jgi:DNA ligase (NAD+)